MTYQLHDSHILSDHLDAGLTRTIAQRLIEQALPIMEQRGYPKISTDHNGRRDAYSCDRMTVTSPGGWTAGHIGPATIKMRGCDHYRRQADAVLKELLYQSPDAHRLGRRPADFCPVCNRQVENVTRHFAYEHKG